MNRRGFFGRLIAGALALVGFKAEAAPPIKTKEIDDLIQTTLIHLGKMKFTELVKPSQELRAYARLLEKADGSMIDKPVPIV